MSFCPGEECEPVVCLKSKGKFVTIFPTYNGPDEDCIWEETEGLWPTPFQEKIKNHRITVSQKAIETA